MPLYNPADHLSNVATQIRAVERAQTSTRRGAAGERGPYQITAVVWSQHTTLPYELADVEAYARPVALRHLAWLRAQLLKAGLTVDTYHLAMAWNAGLTAVVKRRAGSRSVDYAERVTNLVTSSSR